MITIKLPYPPTVNHYKRVGRLKSTKAGKIYQPRVNTEATNRFYYEVWHRIRTQGLLGYADATISLEVSIDLYPPDKRRRDIDNVLKPTLDSLQRGGLIADDYQIARLLVERKHIIDQGEIVVRIQEI